VRARLNRMRADPPFGRRDAEETRSWAGCI
jgi:hypothetical protein